MLLLEYKAPEPETPILKIVPPDPEPNPDLENIEVKETAKSILRFKPFSHKDKNKKSMTPASGFRTGDFVTARVEGWPFLFHRGIIVVEDDDVYIYHNTPMLKNRLGGGVVVEKMDEWVLARDIMSVESTDMTKEYIQKKSTELAGKIYNTVSFNCESYAFGLKDGCQKSPQVFWWGVGLSVAGFILYKIVTRKRKLA